MNVSASVVISSSSDEENNSKIEFNNANEDGRPDPALNKEIQSTSSTRPIRTVLNQGTQSTSATRPIRAAKERCVQLVSKVIHSELSTNGKLLPKKYISKTVGLKRSPKVNSIVNLKNTVSTVVLNDDGDDEEYQLDIHTKSREELEEQKSNIPRPRPSSPTKLVDRPLRRILPKPIESDVLLTNEANSLPKPLLPSLTITPVTKANESQSVPYLKVKNIDALKSKTTDQIEVNSTLEINQSTNLFILNSDQNSSTIIEEALQKLSHQQTDIIVTQTPSTPLFQITNVHTLAKTNATAIKRKREVEKDSKSKRIKTNNNTEVISLDDDENDSKLIDTISLDSDSEGDTNVENNNLTSCGDNQEIVSKLPMPDDENSEDVICIENTIENIDICSSSDTENEILKDNQLETTNEKREIRNIQETDSLKLEKIKEKLLKKINKSSCTENETLKDKPLETTNKQLELENIQNLDCLQLEKMREKLLNKMNKLVRNGDKTVEKQNTEKTVQLQKPQEMSEELENSEKLQNTKKIVESQKTDKILPVQITNLVLENTKRVEELQNTESVQLPEVQNKLQIENSKKPVELQNTKKTDLLNTENSIGLQATDKTVELQENDKIVGQQTIEKTVILKYNGNEIEIQNTEKTVELKNTEKTVELPNTTNTPQLKHTKTILLENNEEDKNQFEKTDDEIDDNESLFEKFLETCSDESVPNKCRLIINESIGKIRKRYEKANIDYLNSNNFTQLLNKKIQEILKTPMTATVAFSDILMELKNNKQETEDEASDIDKETSIKIKKLQTMLKLLHKKIRQLEQTEMSLDDDWDENATYIQEERYKRKCCQIYKKICELQKKDENAGRLTLTKINFQGSNYPKINQAINKLYNKKRQFPNLHDIIKCIKKCVERHKLKLNERDIDDQAREMFKLLGNKLQKRRQKETYQNIMSYTDDILDDPASKDIELEKKLRESHKEANTRIEEIMNKFVQKQNSSGEDARLNDENSNSEKSDSSPEDSEEDTNEDI